MIATRPIPSLRWGSYFTLGSAAFTGARVLVAPAEIVPVCACLGATGLAALAHPRIVLTAVLALVSAAAALRPRHAMLSLRPAFVTVGPRTTARALRRVLDLASDQPIIPVIDHDLALRGIIDPDAIRHLPHGCELVAADLMGPAVTVSPTSPPSWIRRVMDAHRLRAVPLVDGTNNVLALVIATRT